MSDPAQPYGRDDDLARRQRGGRPGSVPAGAVLLRVGRTRARVLTALLAPATTGELARRLPTSLATAGQHVHALRYAALVLGRREGNQVLHILTPLGAALAHGTAV
ncbi:winged helix-turn-helix domain-containing protein [Streptomyces sp. NBC_00631]|uniref:ArsR/SmtB family transcription factor n=1 Tax=Streptomyces sp. NBC_00631 TaxID=2975793 RepID=UPI0030DEF42C